MDLGMKLTLRTRSKKMPKIKLDLSDAVSLSPIEDGTYGAEVVEVKPVAKGQNAQYLPIVLEINDGDYAGRKQFVNIMLTGKAAGRGAEELGRLLGTDFDPEEGFDPDDLLGALCRIVVSQKEYPEGSGEMRNEVKKILAPE